MLIFDQALLKGDSGAADAMLLQERCRQRLQWMDTIVNGPAAVVKKEELGGQKGVKCTA